MPYLLAALALTWMPSLIHPDSTRSDFLVFSRAGDPSSLEEIVAAMADVDVVFLGESHDDSLGHAIEARLFQRAFVAHAGGGGTRKLVLAMEMFERDVQTVLDEYVKDLVRERDFLAASRPWKNYDTDYRPLVEFARVHRIPVVASNAPARYVSRVGREGPAGLEQLSDLAKSWVAPLGYPEATEAYAEKFMETMREMMAATAAPDSSAPSDSLRMPPMPAQSPADSSASKGGMAADTTQAARPAHNNQYMLDAQNLRDATMGYSVARVLQETPRALVVHVNGSFHSNFRLGTPDHLLHFAPQARHLVVSFVSDPSPGFDPESMAELGDFIILTSPE